MTRNGNIQVALPYRKVFTRVRTVATVAALALTLAACSSGGDVELPIAAQQPEANEAEQPTPSGPTIIDAAPERPPFEDLSRLSPYDAATDLLGRLIDARSDRIAPDMVNDMIQAGLDTVLESGGLASYDGLDFAAGIDLEGLSAGELAEWEAVGDSIIAVVAERYALWEGIDSALDASGYERRAIDLLAGTIRDVIAIDIRFYESYLVLYEAEGGAAVVSPAGMRIMGEWLGAEEQQVRTGDLIDAFLALPFQIDRPLLDLFNQAVPVVGLSISGL